MITDRTPLSVALITLAVMILLLFWFIAADCWFIAAGWPRRRKLLLGRSAPSSSR
jgi:hypothetical protein